MSPFKEARPGSKEEIESVFGSQKSKKELQAEALAETLKGGSKLAVLPFVGETENSVNSLRYELRPLVADIVGKKVNTTLDAKKQPGKGKRKIDGFMGFSTEPIPRKRNKNTSAKGQTPKIQTK